MQSKVYSEKTMKMFREATPEQQKVLLARFVEFNLLSEQEARFYNGINTPFEKETTVKNVVSKLLDMDV